MRQQLATFLNPSHPDDDLRRRGRNVVALSLGLIVLALFLMVLWTVQGEYPSLAAGAIMLVAFSVAIAQVRRGQVAPAALTVVAMLTLVVLMVMVANNALSDTPYFLLISVSISGLILPSRQIWPVLGANLLGLGLVTALITRTAPLGYLDVQVLQDSISLLVITGLISYLGARSTGRALGLARTARLAAEAAAADLDRANAVLEARVAERTEELAGALAAQRAQADELQASLARQQALNELVSALALPIIPVREDVLVAPLVGNLDAGRADQLIGNVLQQIERRRARAIILDVTGVAMVDTYLAQVLLRTAQATKLLGAQVVLAGIRPELAQTLVSLGADLGGLRTVATLQDGLAAVG
jgi:anti-anti-sigma factor